MITRNTRIRRCYICGIEIEGSQYVRLGHGVNAHETCYRQVGKELVEARLEVARRDRQERENSVS